MSAMITELLDKGFAYESDGHVFFDVSKYEDYGQLSGNNLESLRGGDRVGEGEVARKRNSADFVLWKPELDSVGWDAPFGKGRPGWHIECSAMAKAVLTDGTKSDTIDIHCGGVDLKFPHHENEIAQSNCAHDGAPLANYWVHNEFLNMGDEKMSKSLGNVKLIHDLLKDWDGEVIRLALLKAHYRSELTWTESLLKESKANLDRVYGFLKEFAHSPVRTDISDEKITNYSFNQFNDDINSPELIKIFLGESEMFGNFSQSYFFGLQRASQGVDSPQPLSYYLGKATSAYTQLKLIANLLGLLQKDPEDWFKGGASADEEAEFDAIALRLSLIHI